MQRRQAEKARGSHDYFKGCLHVPVMYFTVISIKYKFRDRGLWIIVTYLKYYNNLSTQPYRNPL